MVFGGFIYLCFVVVHTRIAWRSNLELQSHHPALRIKLFTFRFRILHTSDVASCSSHLTRSAVIGHQADRNSYGALPDGLADFCPGDSTVLRQKHT